MAENNPSFNPEPPSSASEETCHRADKYGVWLAHPTEERELMELWESRDYFKHQYQILEGKYDNSQDLLRDLYKLEKEKHYYMCNVFFAAFTAAMGSLVMSGVITLWGFIPAAMAVPIGVTLMFISMLLGVAHPLAVEFLWKIFSKRTYSFKCPHCHKSLTDRDAEKEEVKA